MKTKERTLIMFTGLLILALVAAGCQSSQKPKGPPDGDYGKAGYLLTLDQGHFNLRDAEEGSYTVDGDKITFHVENFSGAAQPECGNFPIYTYQWNFDAQASLLTFKVVDDPCPGRGDELTLGHWKYSKLSQ